MSKCRECGHNLKHLTGAPDIKYCGNPYCKLSNKVIMPNVAGGGLGV